MSPTGLWFCEPPVLGLVVPEGTHLCIDGKRVVEILVQLRGKDSENPTLEFFCAMLADVPTVGAENT